MLSHKAITVTTLVMLLTGNTGCLHWKHQFREHSVASKFAAKHPGECHRCSRCGKTAADGFHSIPPEHATESGLIDQGLLESQQPLDLKQMPAIDPISERDIHSSGDREIDAASTTPASKASAIPTPAISNQDPLPFTVKAESHPAEEEGMSTDNAPVAATDKVSTTPAVEKMAAASPVAAQTPKSTLKTKVSGQPTPVKIRPASPTADHQPALASNQRPTPAQPTAGQPTPAIPIKPARKPTAATTKTRLAEAVRPNMDEISAAHTQARSRSSKPLPEEPEILDISAAPREPVADGKAVAWRKPVARIKVAAAPVTTSTTTRFAVARLKTSIAAAKTVNQRVELPLTKVSVRNPKGPIPIRKVKLTIDPPTEDDVDSFSDQRFFAVIVPDDASPARLTIPTPPADTSEAIDALSDQYPTPVSPIKSAEPTIQTQPRPIKQHYFDPPRDESFPTPVRRIRLTRYQDGQ